MYYSPNLTGIISLLVLGLYDITVPKLQSVFYTFSIVSVACSKADAALAARMPVGGAPDSQWWWREDQHHVLTVSFNSNGQSIVTD